MKAASECHSRPPFWFSFGFLSYFPVPRGVHQGAPWDGGSPYGLVKGDGEEATGHSARPSQATDACW